MFYHSWTVTRLLFRHRLNVTLVSSLRLNHTTRPCYVFVYSNTGKRHKSVLIKQRIKLPQLNNLLLTWSTKSFCLLFTKYTKYNISTIYPLLTSEVDEGTKIHVCNWNLNITYISHYTVVKLVNGLLSHKFQNWISNIYIRIYYASFILIFSLLVYIRDESIREASNEMQMVKLTEKHLRHIYESSFFKTFARIFHGWKF